jgi:serine/threonine protein phosphatase PrpC/CRP-like cAMP-binding protein
MQFQGHGMSHTGRVRDHNEDAFLIDENLGLYVVCDGLGGHAAGEVASKLACQTIRDHLDKHREVQLASSFAGVGPSKRDVSVNAARDAVQAANLAVFEMAQSDPKYHGMGCTVVMLWTIGHYAVVAHAGDSRIYLMRLGELHQLTEDHSKVDEQLNRGLITPEEARRSADAAGITRAVGTTDHVEPEFLFMDLIGHDRFLLCTDGLTRHVESDTLREHFDRFTDEEVPSQLVDLANERGGYDNITAISVGVGSAPRGRDAEVVQKFEKMRTIPLFKGFDYVELMKVLSASLFARFPKGKRIVREGGVDSRLWVCTGGSVQVIKKGHVINELGPGDFFGEMSLIDKRPSSVDVVTTKPSHMLVWSRHHFFSLIDRDRYLASRILWRLCRVLNQRLRHTIDHMVSIESGDSVSADQVSDALSKLAKTTY